MSAPKPQAPAPELAVETLGDGGFRLSDQQPDRFTMIVFYRGVHCPVCTKYVGDLGQRVGEFRDRGVDVVAVSGDSRERAERAQAEWNLGDLEVGYGLSTEAMREWGLFVSRGITDEEPDEFSEPGLFLIDSEGAVFYEGINSMPFGRPPLDEMRDAVDFVGENDYPARGEA
ncbi:peroxiredoxin-like family protein [soil metagenome]|jgi:peroxiredoxin|nr:AhpC/TSA family protein [Thermoleophilaceae bacterium]MDQ3319105.1 AhpC/TSA family protein [Actinomycetota bacterium]